MGVEIQTQIKELAPSAKNPLFRRLMVVEELAYLREENSIIGFEVDTEMDQALSGFALIGIGKHTIYAMCSDIHEPPRLILFPPLDKLFDPAFGLIDLQVTRMVFTDGGFQGTVQGKGTLRDLVKDLTPPEKDIDIPIGVIEQMADKMQKPPETPPASQAAPTEAPPAEETFAEGPPPDEFIEEPPESDYEGYDNYEEPGYDAYEEPGYDDYEEPGYNAYEESGYDDYEEPGYDNYEEPPAPTPPPETAGQDARSTQLLAQTFKDLREVTEYCELQFKIPHTLTTELANRTLNSKVSPEFRVTLLVKLFCKLFDEHKI